MPVCLGFDVVLQFSCPQRAPSAWLDWGAGRDEPSTPIQRCSMPGRCTPKPRPPSMTLMVKPMEAKGERMRADICLQENVTTDTTVTVLLKC